jgi:hypothetical protein
VGRHLFSVLASPNSTPLRGSATKATTRVPHCNAVIVTVRRPTNLAGLPASPPPCKTLEPFLGLRVERAVVFADGWLRGGYLLELLHERQLEQGVHVGLGGLGQRYAVGAKS